MAEAAAHAAAIAQALKASGVIVRLEPSEFLKILSRQDEPLVVQAHGGFFRSSWQYLTSYRGLAFFTKSAEQLPLPGRADVVVADSIWIPGSGLSNLRLTLSARGRRLCRNAQWKPSFLTAAPAPRSLSGTR